VLAIPLESIHGFVVGVIGGGGIVLFTSLLLVVVTLFGSNVVGCDCVGGGGGGVDETSPSSRQLPVVIVSHDGSGFFVVLPLSALPDILADGGGVFVSVGLWPPGGCECTTAYDNEGANINSGINAIRKRMLAFILMFHLICGYYL
jgi:hypothetical protein